MKYRKKPIEIEAILWDGDNIRQIRSFCGDSYIDYHMFDNWVLIKTLEGEYKVPNLTRILKGIKGEVYPCRKDIFEETYDEI